MDKNTRKARTGRKQEIWSVKRMPRWSATTPKTVVIIPPMPMASPMINPEAIPML